MSKTEKPKTPAKSWRDVVNIHPAADLFPMMSPDELKVLGEDIKRNGMSAPIVWWTEREADIGKTPPPQYYLLDGRNRLDAMEIVGIRLVDVNGKTPACGEDVRYGEGVPRINAITGNRSVERTDPYEYVLSANVHRRHLTNPQKHELVAKVLKAQPEKSNRTIAKQTKVDDKTVGSVRRELEGRAEIPHVSTVEDTKGRKQPMKKARRTADEIDAKARANAVADRAEERSRQTQHIAEEAQKETAQTCSMPKQSDLEHVLPDADCLVLEVLERDKISPGYALAVARGLAAPLGDRYPEMPGFLKRTAEPTAPAALG